MTDKELVTGIRNQKWQWRTETDSKWFSYVSPCSNGFNPGFQYRIVPLSCPCCGNCEEGTVRINWTVPGSPYVCFSCRCTWVEPRHVYNFDSFKQKVQSSDQKVSVDFSKPTDTEMQPCPFCGVVPECTDIRITGEVDCAIFCRNCQCSGPRVNANGTKYIELWNKRNKVIKP
jgi:hypothetical protein